MALTKLDPVEIRNFLQSADPALLGVIGTYGADGYPHLVPVWYHYDGEHVHIWTLATRAWVKNAGRDSRVAFSVQEEGAAARGVSIRGRAAIVTGDPSRVTDEIRAITLRYVPDPLEANVYIQRWPDLRTIVSITPEKITGWRDDGA
ncbi:MAG: pyridoxamine 5'-phosphate oxidase family protein [Anaerolineales bacterium]